MKKNYALLLLTLSISSALPADNPNEDAPKATKETASPVVRPASQFAKRVLYKMVARALVGGLKSGATFKDGSLVAQNGDKLDVVKILDPVVDWGADEFIPLHNMGPWMKICEWFVPKVVETLVEKRADLSKRPHAVYKGLIVKSALEAAAKKKLFLAEDHPLRSTLDIPLVSIGLSVTKFDDSTNKLTANGTEFLPEIAQSILSEGIVKESLIPWICNQSPAFGSWIMEKKCRQDLVKAMAGEFIRQAAVRTLAQWSVEGADLPA